MPQINQIAQEIHCKLVYCGPAGSGKSANLAQVHARTPEQGRGLLRSVSSDGDGDQPFEFEHASFELGKVEGYRTFLQVYSLPSIKVSRQTHDRMLEGIDGMVFVADSSAARVQENNLELLALRAILRQQGRDLDKLPLVFQWNKRDAEDALPVRVLEKRLNSQGRPSIQAVVTEELGVLSAFKSVAEQALAEAHAQLAITPREKPKVVNEETIQITRPKAPEKKKGNKFEVVGSRRRRRGLGWLVPLAAVLLAAAAVGGFYAQSAGVLDSFVAKAQGTESR